MQLDADLMRRLLVETSDAERDLLVLLVGGADLDEARLRLGLSPSALKVRLHRVRRRAAAVTGRAKVGS